MEWNNNKILHYLFNCYFYSRTHYNSYLYYGNTMVTGELCPAILRSILLEIYWRLFWMHHWLYGWGGFQWECKCWLQTINWFNLVLFFPNGKFSTNNCFLALKVLLGLPSLWINFLFPESPFSVRFLRNCRFWTYDATGKEMYFRL